MKRELRKLYLRIKNCDVETSHLNLKKAFNRYDPRSPFYAKRRRMQHNGENDLGSQKLLQDLIAEDIGSNFTFEEAMNHNPALTESILVMVKEMGDQYGCYVL